MPARVANLMIGVWLFVSAFLFRSSPEQMTNSWIVGLLCIAFALASLAMPGVRYLNTALALWLFVSAFALPRISDRTLWNHVVCSVAIFLLSLAPSEPVRDMMQTPVRQHGV